MRVRAWSRDGVEIAALTRRRGDRVVETETTNANPVLAYLREVAEKADSIYVQQGRHLIALSAADEDVTARFVVDQVRRKWGGKA